MKLGLWCLRSAASFRNQSALLYKTGVALGYEVDERDVSQRSNLKKDYFDRSIMLAPLWPRYVFDAVRLSAPWLGRHFTFYGPVDGPFTLNVTFFKVLAQMEIVTTSRWCMDQIRKSGVNVKGYCYHGIDPKDFKFSKAQIQGRRERILRSFPESTIFFSNCNPLHRKGFVHLFKALDILSKRRPDGWVFVLHTGKAKALKLAAGLAKIKRVILEDQYNVLPFRQVALKTVACDCFVWPTLEEGFGLPWLEAAAAGRPGIGVNAGPMNEILRGREAFLFPFREVKEEVWKAPGVKAQLHCYNPGDLAEAMIYVMDHPEEAREKGVRAKKRSRDFHYKKVYEPLIKGEI